MAKNFADFLESMTIAMEADDITGEVANEVRSAVGGTPSTEMDSDTREDVEDLNKVDDIFGIQGDTTTDGPSGDPTQDQQEGSENLPPEETSQGPNVEQGEPESQETEEEEVDPNLAFAQKNRVRDNMVQLYNIIASDIEVIVNSMNNVNDMETIQVLNAILNNLRNAKDYLYKTLTQNLISLEYDELLQRYITLKRVYDICAKMIKKHFEKDKTNKK